MRSAVIFAFVGVLGVFVSQGCGGVQGGETETKRSELGSFGSWTSMGGLLLDSPSLARTQSTTLTAFGLGTDSQIWTTAQNSSGQWTGNWTPLPGGRFASRPAAVGLNLPSGDPLANFFAIVAMRDDGTYYVRVQNQSGSQIALDWSEVAGNIYWTSAPALVFVPATAADPYPSVVVAGNSHYGLEAWQMYLSRVTNYAPNAWEGFAGHQNITEDFRFDRAPALAFVPPALGTSNNFILAVGMHNSSGIAYKSAPYSNNAFTPLQDVPNGLFLTAPALAAGIQGQLMELTIFGLGTDYLIYRSNDLGSSGFSPIGGMAFETAPTATGLGNQVWVSSLSFGRPFTATATSP